MRAGNPAFLLRLVVRPATSVAFFVIIAFALLSRALDSSVLAKTVVTHPPTTATTAFRAATATATAATAAAISSAMSDASVHRAIDLVVPGTKTSDGAGVKLTRSIGSRRLPELDPFLMLDFFGSDDPDAYIAGFPDHPHRGFETVTYMIAGNMQHRDHCGNEGNLVAGSIQWMTAGKGIIHSEIPKQDEGLMQGFQLWCDLPNAMRMCDPRYQDIPPEDVPVVETDDGSVTVKVLAGSYGETTGPVKDVVTEPSYLDVTLAAGAEFEAEITKGHTCFAYVFQGSVDTGGRTIAEQNLVVFDRDSEADTVGLNGGESGGRFILVSGMPLNQTKVHYGPFVMETMEEIQQAFDDYRNGILGEYPSDE